MHKAFQQATDLIEQSHKILLTMHERMDGDDGGALLAMGHQLEKMGKVVTYAIKKGVPPYLSFLPGAEKIADDIEHRNFDLLITFGCSSKTRCGSEPPRQPHALAQEIAGRQQHAKSLQVKNGNCFAHRHALQRQSGKKSGGGKTGATQNHKSCPLRLPQGPAVSRCKDSRQQHEVYAITHKSHEGHAEVGHQVFADSIHAGKYKRRQQHQKNAAQTVLSAI